MSTTRALANLVVDTKFDHLQTRVVERAKICILDWLGSAIAGSSEPPARITASLVRDIGGTEESTVIATTIKTSCVNAALANGIAGHSIEMDDVHVESIIHPAAPVVPAALAVGERHDSSGEDLIASVILGYEVEIRVGMAVMPSHYRYWHPTGTCGTFGAAAAAGKIMNLDEKEMVHAFGIAGTQAAGLVDVFGTMSKPLNPGCAGRNGVIAALLAKEGFTSSESILESERGFCQATSENRKQNKIIQDLGGQYEIMNNVFKRHASCGHTHGAIDALLHIVEKFSVDPSIVDKIEVGTYPIAAEIVGRNNVAPRTASEARFSLPYCLAIALLRGEVGPKEFTEESLTDPRIPRLLKTVKVTVDPEFVNARLGPANVSVYTKLGKRFSHRVYVPKGHPQKPLTKADIENKFKTLASVGLPHGKVEETVNTMNVLEKLDTVSYMTSLLSSE